MAKKIILTQKQLDEIIGGNSDYLDSIGSDFREDGLNAVYTGEKKSDSTDDEPVTTDKIAKEVPRPPYYYRTNTRASYFSESKRNWEKRNIVKEENTTNISIDPTTKKNMVAGSDSAGANAVKNGFISHNNAKTIKTRMSRLKNAIKKGNEQALNTYNNMGGDILYDKIEKELKNKTDINNRNKQYQKNIGIQTDIRDVGNGKGHNNDSLLDVPKVQNVTALQDNPYKASLGEAKSIQSKKLFDIVKQHGGFYKEPYLRGRKTNHDIRMTNADLHNLTDDQVIGVVAWDKIKSTIQDIRKNRLYGFIPGDDIDYVQLNDGNYLLLMVKNAHQYNREYQKGDFQDLVDKMSERDRNTPYVGKHNNNYQWKSTDAQHYAFNNPYYKDWDEESKERLRRKIKDDYKKQ